MTQILYLLRHAKAEAWSPGIDDFGRCLSLRGTEHMLQLSAWMQEYLPMPGTVLCSSSRRTQETLAPILDTWPGLADRTEYLREIYEATTGTLHAIAGEAFKESQSVMMVGHNPGFEYLALRVLRDSDAREIEKMATGTLAVIEFENGYEADCGNGVLSHWIRRKNLSDH